MGRDEINYEPLYKFRQDMLDFWETVIFGILHLAALFLYRPTMWLYNKVRISQGWTR